MDILDNRLIKLLKFLFYLISFFIITNFLTNGVLIISLPIFIYIFINYGGISFLKIDMFI